MRGLIKKSSYNPFKVKRRVELIEVVAGIAACRVSRGRYQRRIGARRADMQFVYCHQVRGLRGYAAAPRPNGGAGMTAPNNALPYFHRRAIEEILYNVGPRVLVQQIAAQLREQAQVETRDGNLELAANCALNATRCDMFAADFIVVDEYTEVPQ